MTEQRTPDLPVVCDDCGNSADDPEVGYFVQSDRTGAWRCTKCGSRQTRLGFEVADIRHVNDTPDGDVDIPPDFEATTHLVAKDDPDTALCGQPVEGLRPAGKSVTSLESAAKLGAWVNVRDDMCPECREAFNERIFQRPSHRASPPRSTIQP